MSKFTYASLFSGIGGFEQALNKLGGTCVFASEIDKFAAQAYETLYGEKPHGDITKIDAKDIPDHDLLVGGFPCQSFSVAGKRKGFEDTRGTLFFEIARIAKEKRPKALLLENVKGLVNHDKGRTLDVMIETLNEIGYVVDFEILNSKYFGVPQNRERIFIVAIREDLIEQSPWIIEGNTIVPKGKRRISEYEWAKTFNFDWPEQVEVTTRLRDILESNVDEKYYLDEEKTAKLVAQLESSATDEVRATALQNANMQGRRIKENDEPSFTVSATDRHGVTLSEPCMLGHVDIKGNDSIKRVYSVEHVGPTLTTMTGGHRQPKIALEDSEIWTPIKDFEGIYEVSNHGRVKSLSRKINTGRGGYRILPEIIKTPKTDKDGYLETSLSKNGLKKYVSIHRLVAEAFLPNPENKEQVNHKDGDKKNNHVSNLEWVTAQENQTHKKEVLRSHGSKPNKPRGASWNKEKRKWQSKIKMEDRTMHLGWFDSKEEAQSAYFEKFKEAYGYEPWEISDNEVEEIRPVLTINRMEKRQNGRRFKDNDEESFTLTSQDKHGIAIGHQPKYRIRKLTPLECWRLQGFPDEAHEAVKQAGISDSQRYKQAGNAVTVSVIEAIAKRLIPLIVDA